MKKTLFALLVINANLGLAQQTATWIGGCPGQETKWNVAKNWSNNRVPDEFTTVILKPLNTGHQAQPIVSEPIKIAAIQIHAQTLLTIAPKGVLEINGEFTYSDRILILEGKLINQGELMIKNVALSSNEQQLIAKIEGNGTLLMNSKKANTYNATSTELAVNQTVKNHSKQFLRTRKRNVFYEFALQKPSFCTSFLSQRHCKNVWAYK